MLSVFSTTLYKMKQKLFFTYPVTWQELVIFSFCVCADGHRASVSEVNHIVEAAYGNATCRPMFCHLSVAQCPLPVPLPYPSIFRNLVGQHGELLNGPYQGLISRGSLNVHSVPMAARLRSSSAVLPFSETKTGETSEVWN